VSDYLTGHGGDGDVGRDYGDYRDAAVNGIAKLKSPLETVVVG
jgi:hypothetical protein